MSSHPVISHESIARRAHCLWEEAGRPHGQETAHWLQAEHELRLAERGPDGEAGRGKAAEPPAAAKHGHVPEKTPHSTAYAPPGVTADSLHHHRNRSGQPR
jgi:Protein of unknown function (DUF2934)